MHTVRLMKLFKDDCLTVCFGFLDLSILWATLRPPGSIEDLDDVI
jgi:hypothetical protein